MKISTYIFQPQKRILSAETIPTVSQNKESAKMSNKSC